MTDEEKSIQKNLIIITICVLFFVFVVAGHFLLEGTINDTLNFRYTYNQRTGERNGILESVFLYTLLWWIVGTYYVPFPFLFSMLIYFLLHIKDRKIFNKGYHPKHEKEFFFGGAVACVATYAVALVLVILYAAGLITIKAF